MFRYIYLSVVLCIFSFNSSLAQECENWSPLACSEIHKTLPIALDWSASHGGVNDGAGVGTGFTVVAPPSSRNVTLDGSPSNANLPGYEPSKLSVTNGLLNISTNRGIFFKSGADGGNSQINSLGIGINALTNPMKITTKMVNLPTAGTRDYQQGGIWFGLGEADYVKLVVINHTHGNANIYEVQLVYELNDRYLAAESEQTLRDIIAPGNDIVLQMIADPDTRRVQGFYSLDNGVSFKSVGPAVTVTASFFNGIKLGNATVNSSFAGLFATQRNSPNALSFSFDSFNIEEIARAAVNLPPTLDPIANPAPLPINTSTPQTVNLSGITAGEGETQVLTVVATSNNPGLIPNPTVVYTSPANTGTLTYTPVANKSGVAEITVTVQDNGSNLPPSENSISRTFTVNVSGPDNQTPYLEPIADPAPIDEDAGEQTIALEGITAGESDQTITITAVSDNEELIPNPTVTYTSPNATGTINYTPVANASGTVVITVTVTDNGSNTGDNRNSFSQSFTVVVNPVNDAPFINEIADQNTGIDVPLGPITFTIGDVDDDVKELTVTATSSNQALVPNANIVLGGTEADRTFTITPVTGQQGSTTITLTVSDGELTGVRSFNLIVGVTSIRNEVNKQEMLFYPNPSNSIVNLQFKNNIMGDVNIQIFDLAGRVHKNLSLQKQGEIFNHTLNIDELSKGSYFIQVKQKGNIISKRLIKF